jgi:hypothetical protein
MQRILKKMSLKHSDRHIEAEMSVGIKESPIHKTISTEEKVLPKKMFTSLNYVGFFKIEKN